MRGLEPENEPQYLLAVVRFTKGTPTVLFTRYDVANRQCDAALYRNKVSVQVNHAITLARSCTCGGEPEPVEYVTRMGHGPATACRGCRALTKGVKWDRPVWAENYL